MKGLGQEQVQYSILKKVKVELIIYQLMDKIWGLLDLSMHLVIEGGLMNRLD